MYSIGEIISTYRKKKGLLQQDLADELAKEGITSISLNPDSVIETWKQLAQLP